MKVNDFLAKAHLALKSHTQYCSGGFGVVLKGAQLDRYCNNYTWNKNHEAKIRKAAETQPCYGFDCVCLVKGILWGWDANPDKIYGGAAYKSNDVPDITAQGMIKACTDVSTDFSKIQPGEVLYLESSPHIGIYIGDGLAIEATASWDCCVMKTAVTNIKSATGGLHGRKWTKHGKLPWVDYSESGKPEMTCPCCGARFVLA